jgi:arabinogalactan oligomer / maltooligosaccharide transport system permease protein
VTTGEYAAERIAERPHVAKRRIPKGFGARMLKRLVLWAVIVLTLAPGYWVVEASLSKGSAFFSQGFPPHDLTFENYRSLWADTDFPLWVKNSMILCVSVATIATVISSLSAYAFSRVRFRGRRWGLITMLLIQMFPTTVALPAYYLVLLWLGEHTTVGGTTILGLDTYQGLILILAGGSLAFQTWLAKGYFDNLPPELEEAAFVDGATRLRALWHVILPLAKPMLAVNFLFTFIGIYSEFILTSLVINTNRKKTLPLGLNDFISDQFAQHWTQFAAAAVLTSIPILIVFMAMQRYLVSGLARGAVRG